MQRQLMILSGLVSVILFIVAFGIAGEAPGNGEPAATVKAFYVDNASSQSAAGYIAMIAIPFLLIFAAAVRTVLIEAGGGESSIWANVFFAGAMVASAGFLFLACLSLALGSEPEALGSSAAQSLNTLSNESYPLFAGGLGVLLLGAGGALIPVRSGLRWLGWAALPLGIITFTPFGFAGFIGAGLWIVLASVALTMHLRAHPAGLRESAATA